MAKIDTLSPTLVAMLGAAAFTQDFRWLIAVGVCAFIFSGLYQLSRLNSARVEQAFDEEAILRREKIRQFERIIGTPAE